MSWDKRALPGDVIHYPGKQETEYYLYTPGIHGREMAEFLKRGKVPGMLCGDQLLLPPKTFCPDAELSKGDVIEVTGPFTVALVTVVYEDFYGNKLEEPQVLGLITVPGAVGGYLGVINADPDSVYPGMKVRPVFKKEEERTGAITDIMYWEPVED
ncbi:MAG: Zn-ribbon domain-containing OB-fold protein [Desulfurococcales archaeon]|nr:Zn-ribbon domain-containing OB-fold protein [Desulfurococcales archaeon]MEB3806955.1 Zn-ribbon domain-containing OB-fold protein [Desulfurococcales archaeon]